MKVTAGVRTPVEPGQARADDAAGEGADAAGERTDAAGEGADALASRTGRRRDVSRLVVDRLDPGKIDDAPAHVLRSGRWRRSLRQGQTQVRRRCRLDTPDRSLLATCRRGRDRGRQAAFAGKPDASVGRWVEAAPQDRLRPQVGCGHRVDLDDRPVSRSRSSRCIPWASRIASPWRCRARAAWRPGSDRPGSDGLGSDGPGSDRPGGRRSRRAARATSRSWRSRGEKGSGGSLRSRRH